MEWRLLLEMRLVYLFPESFLPVAKYIGALASHPAPPQETQRKREFIRPNSVKFRRLKRKSLITPTNYLNASPHLPISIYDETLIFLLKFAIVHIKRCRTKSVVDRWIYLTPAKFALAAANQRSKLIISAASKTNCLSTSTTGLSEGKNCRLISHVFFVSCEKLEKKTSRLFILGRNFLSSRI